MYYSKLNRYFPSKYPISSTSKNDYIFIFKGFFKKKKNARSPCGDICTAF